MKNKIKISFKCFWGNIDNIGHYYFLNPLDENNIDYELVDAYKEECDICFVSVFDVLHKDMLIGNPITIWYTGEYVDRVPNFYSCDYSLSFNKNSDTNLYLPLWQIHTYRINNNYIKDKTSINKDRFCCFIVSNGEAQHRINVFNYINNNYKKIDSIGHVLNNCNYILPSGDYIYPRRYKFNLCFENREGAYDNYYITEKIVNAYAYNCVPIYCGSTHIEEIFNPKSFINANNMSNEDLCEYIKEIDTHDNLYNEMLNTYPFNDTNVNYDELWKRNYVEFIKHILEKQTS